MVVEADIKEVFYADNQNRVELGATREEAVTLDWQRFPLFPNMSTEIEFSRDPSDGGNYTCLIGMFIDDVEAAFVTDWIPNTDDDRDRVYTLRVPQHPVRLMQRGRTHKVQFKLGYRRTVFGIPLPTWITRNYDLAESEPLYYKIGKAPE